MCDRKTVGRLEYMVSDLANGLCCLVKAVFELAKKNLFSV